MTQAEPAPTASSSRRTAVKALLGVAALAATATFATRQKLLRGPGAPASRAPLLVWNDGAAKPASDPSNGLPRALWLVLGSLTSEARATALADVAELLDGIQAQHLPLGLDLSDDPPSVIARRLQKALLPAWTAARSLVRESWSASDGSLNVHLAAAGEAPSNGITASAWVETERNTLAARARFLAWPVSNAVLLDAGTPAHAARLAAILRAEVPSESALVGLVVDAAVQRITPPDDTEPARRELERRLQRLAEPALKRLGEAESFARALRTGLPAAPLLPWLELHPSELLIVPRLSSLARRPRFLSDLDRAARSVSPGVRRVAL